jgi:tetratricopeptide (TPR) repeat protein
MTTDTLQSARLRRLMTEGTDALGDATGKRDLAKAEHCFRNALELLRHGDAVGDPTWAVAWDRLALVCDMQDRLEEAETCYLHSLAAQEAAGWPPEVCDDLTLLRLGQLYGTVGKRNLQLAIIKRMEQQDRCSCWRNAEWKL